MREKRTVMKAAAYRVPRFKWGGLIKSVFTFGFSNRKLSFDGALLYVFELDSGCTLRAYSENAKGEREEMFYEKMSPEEFTQLVQEKGKYKMEDYIYKFDKETFERDE